MITIETPILLVLGVLRRADRPALNFCYTCAAIRSGAFRALGEGQKPEKREAEEDWAR